MQNAPSLNETTKSSSAIKQIGLFSILFAVLILFIYKGFIFEGKGFCELYDDKDNFAQRYMFLTEFKRFLGGLFSGGQINTWDWSFGLGSDAYQLNISNLFNPFSYITLLFPVKYLDLGYFICVLLRLYVAGLTFIAFARKVFLNDLQIVIGSITYALCPWNIIVSVPQGQFLIGPILLPLVFLGIEKILRGESPVMFILIVAYTLIENFQMAYMIGLMTVLYFVIRYFTDYNEKSIVLFFKKLGVFILYGLLGIMTSAMGFMMTIVRYGSSTLSTTRVNDILLSAQDYAIFPSRLITWTTVFGNYSIIGISAICFIMIPVIVFCMFRKRFAAIMAVICIVMAAIPAFSNAMNFFSYPTGRWMFILAFFFVWATVEALDEKYLKFISMKIAILGTCLLYAGYMAWFWVKHDVDEVAFTTSMANCIVMIALFAVVVIKYSGFTIDRPALAHTMSIVLVGVVCVGSIYVYAQKMPGHSTEKLHFGEAYSLLQESPQHVATAIEDKDFWRVDQAEGIICTRDIVSNINENIYWGNRSVYEFASSVDAGWLEFNKLMGNNDGYYKRTSPNGNDDRMGLELLEGTKYYIGNSVNGSPDASLYAPYGFENNMIVDGTSILKNKYSIGLGAVYDRYISQKEWLKLSYLEREIAMLNSVVMPDSFAGAGQMACVNNDIPATGVKELPYKLEAKGDVSIDEQKGIISVGTNEADITVDEIYNTGTTKSIFGSATIEVPNYKGGQLLISFENASNSVDGGKYSYKLRFSEGNVQKYVTDSQDSSQGLSDITDASVNMGSTKAGKRTINLDFVNNGGEFTFDNLKVYSTDNALFDEYASNLQAKKLNISKINGDTIKGSIDTDKGGILYLSILDNNGWDIFIDGQKAQKIDETNIAFTGVEVKAGYHDVKLVYHSKGSLIGIFVTIVGLAIVVLIWKRRKLKEY